jgi:hypothetical protein
MTKILVNSPLGTQEIIEIGFGGGYFDKSLIIWDERVDGALPEVTLGGMVRNNNLLIFNQDVYDKSKEANPTLPAPEEVREIRNKMLKSSDWTQVLDAAVDQVAWATYRQALRDIPQQEGFPATVVWPSQPE